MQDQQAATLLDLPIDALALIISGTELPKDGVSLRLACRSLNDPVDNGALLATARILCCEITEVYSCARAAPGEDALRTAAFVTHSHNCKKLAAACDHSLLARGQSILSCGANDSGQLGIGRISQFNSTVLVPNTPHAAVYAARQQQMVEGFDPATPAAVQLALPAGVTITSLAAGRSHSLAAASDGQLYAWGRMHVQSGDNPWAGPSTQSIPSPEAVVLDLTDDDALCAAVGRCALHITVAPSRMRWVTQVAAGQLHSAFLLSGGAVFCCGAGSAGELGDGEMCDAAAPVRARLPEAARAIAAGGFHTLAIGAGPARRVYGWGSAACRQLGEYTLERGCAHRLGGLPPSAVYGQATPAALATFARHRSHADDTEEIATSEETESDAVASAFLGVAPAVAVPLDRSAKPFSSAPHGATHDDGAGDASSAAAQPGAWIHHRELPPCAQLAAGSHHSLLLTQRGHVIGCGKNSNGQLGLGHRIASDPPSVVGALSHTRIVSIAAGASHSAFVDVDGNLFTCGRIANGRLGFDEAMVDGAPPSVRTASDNTYTRPPMQHCARPMRVAFPGNLVLRVCTVVAGNDHTIALMTDGRAFSFGRGQAGQLASGSRNDRLQPGEMLPVSGGLAQARSGQGPPSVSIADDTGPTPVPVVLEDKRTTAGASGSWRSGSCVATFTAGAQIERPAVSATAIPDVSAREDDAGEAALDSAPARAMVVSPPDPAPALYTPVCRSFSRW